jgi:recombination DNA repair RAD52 pathway protein
MEKNSDSKKEKFLKVLIVELEDLDEDIKMLIEECKDKHSHEEISNYVYLENIAVLQNELFGVEGFIEDIRSINIDDFETVENLIDDLLKQIKERVREKGLVHSIIYLVERKIKKVAYYIC